MRPIAESKKITLKCFDGETFVVERMIEDVGSHNEILVPNVTGEILAKVIEYCCKKHVEAGADKDKNVTAATEKDETLKGWDTEFVKVDQPTLYDLIKAADYLKVEGLRDLAFQTVADRIKGKTPEERREIFNIKKDFAPEEEEEICRENQLLLDVKEGEAVGI